MQSTHHKNSSHIDQSLYSNIYHNQTLTQISHNSHHKPIQHSHTSTHNPTDVKSADSIHSIKGKKQNGKQQKISAFLYSDQSENNGKNKHKAENNSIHKTTKKKKQKPQKYTAHKQQKSHIQQRKQNRKKQQNNTQVPAQQFKKKQIISKHNKTNKTNPKQKNKGQQEFITIKTIKNRPTNTNRPHPAVEKSQQVQTKLIIDLTNKNKKQMGKKTTYRMNSKGHHSNTKLNSNYVISNLLQLPSTREYCVIKGKFIPLQFSTDRKRLQNIFIQTACTSPEISHKRSLNQTKSKNYFHNQQIENRQPHNNVQKTSSSAHADIGVQTMKKQLANYQVLVKAAQQDVGVQYSDRFNFVYGKSIQIQKQVKQKVKLRLQQMQNSKNLTESQKSQRSVLLDAMMKLQALEINQNFPLDKLNKQQKKHFRQIFSSLIIKMKSPRSDLPPNHYRKCEKELEIQSLKKGKLKEVNDQQKNEQLQHALMIRQSRQINELNVFLIESDQQFDTSVLAVLSTFADIFSYVQMNYQDSIIKTMNNLYGLSYTDKFLTISKYYTKKSKVNDNQFPVSLKLKLQILHKQNMQKSIPDSIFHNFIFEIAEQFPHQQHQAQSQKVLSSKIVIKKNNQYDQSFKQIHSKCIFDCINELLIPYRPFYSTKGDPFPWTMSPLKCLTFYSIDSQSLQTVIEQIQQKLVKILKTLCGLHIQPSLYVGKDYQEKQQSHKWEEDRIFCIRRERLTKCIVEECQIQHNAHNESYLEFQIDTTCILYEVSLIITQQLYQQMVSDIIRIG